MKQNLTTTLSAKQKFSFAFFFANTHSLSFIIFVLVCFLNSYLFAQTNEQRLQIKSKTNVAALQQLAIDLGNFASQRRAIAEQWAIAHGFPLSGVKPDGQEFFLIDYDSINGPQYIVTNNLNSAKTISTNKLWAGGISGLNLSGFQISISMWDGGGVCSQHPEYINRVFQGTHEINPGNVTPSDHATHVAGTLVASGIDPNAHGMAPLAELYYYWAGYYSSTIPWEAADGMLLSNNSWALGRGWWFNGIDWYWNSNPAYSECEYFGLYTIHAQWLDQFANNAPYFLIVKSAGNERGYGPPANTVHFHGSVGGFTDFHEVNGASGFDCMDDASCAKNILTVGATYDIPNGYTVPTDVVLEYFSNTGSTDDGRIKPDVVANGDNLYSTYPIISGDCSLLGYYSNTGTSMSAPSVTGSAALLQEHYSNTHGGSFMLASTIKALIIESADEAGTNNGPDYQNGWGLMNTYKAAEIITKDQSEPSTIQELTLANGQTIDIPFTITNPNTCFLSATIVWNDPAGTPPPVVLDPSNLMLVNDLDLRIIDPSTGTNFPWTLDPANPGNAAVQTADNFRDNVEQVRIYNAVPGLYTVRITHKGTLLNPQDFSIIIYSTSIVDLFMQDTPSDNGIEPNPNTGPMWISEDVWVRNSNDGFTDDTHQDPIYSPTVPNYVYIRIRNRGCQASPGTEQLKAYWAKASTGLTWPDNWNGSSFPGYPGVLEGNILPPDPQSLIPRVWQNNIISNATFNSSTSSVTIPAINPDPNDYIIIEIPWFVPDPDDYYFNPEPWHFCLVSRIETNLVSPFGMTFPETSDINYNVNSNNNIVWKNLMIVPGKKNISTAISNVKNIETCYNLAFKVPIEEANNSIINNAKITIDLGEALYQKWVTGGQLATGIEIDNTQRYSLKIVSPVSKIKNLIFQPDEMHFFNLRVNYSALYNDEQKSDFMLDAIQEYCSDSTVVGGIRYAFHKPVCPIPDAGADTIICAGGTATLTASPIIIGAIYNWYNKQTNLLVDTGATITVSPVITTTYELEMISPNGCIDNDEITVTAIPFPYKTGLGITIGTNTIIDNSVVIGDSITIGNNVIIKQNTVIGDGTTIGNNTAIEKDVVIGEYNIISENVKIKKESLLGAHVTLGNNVMLDEKNKFGSFVTVAQNSKLKKECAIASGSMIGAGNTYDNNVSIGSNVIVQDSVNIKKQVAIGDNSTIGNNVKIAQYAKIGSGATVNDNLTIGANAIICDDLSQSADLAANGKTGTCASPSAPAIAYPGSLDCAFAIEMAKRYGSFFNNFSASNADTSKIDFCTNRGIRFYTKRPATTYYWDFGDCSTSTEQSPVHTYAKPGIYVITLILNPPCWPIKYIGAIRILPETKPSFDVITTVNCFSDNIFRLDKNNTVIDLSAASCFTNTAMCKSFALLDSSLFRIKFNWDFGTIRQPLEEIFSFSQIAKNLDSNITCNYPSLGAYPVTLTATLQIKNKITNNWINTDCIKTFKDTVYPGKVIEANFISDTIFCFGDSVRFNTSVSGGIKPYSYQLFFNPDTAIIVPPPVIIVPPQPIPVEPVIPTEKYEYAVFFDTPGEHHITLIVTDSLGCSDTAIQTVTIRPPIVASITSDTIFCFGDSIPFTSTVEGGIPPYTYQWSFNPDTIVGIKKTSYITDTIIIKAVQVVAVSPVLENTIKFYSPGEHHITLIVTDSLGCSDTAIKTITVNPLPVAEAGNDTTIIAGDSVQIGSSPVNGYTYLWNPATGLSSITVAQPWAKPATSTTYYLTVTNTYSCTKKDSIFITTLGTSCENAIEIVPNLICIPQTFAITDTVMWFKFTADTSYINIIVSDVDTSGSGIKILQLYSGNCNNLSLIMQVFDTLLITENNLTDSNSYYIKIKKQLFNPTYFSICLKKTKELDPPIPVFTCEPSICPNLNLIINGGFDNAGTPPITPNFFSLYDYVNPPPLHDRILIGDNVTPPLNGGGWTGTGFGGGGNFLACDITNQYHDFVIWEQYIPGPGMPGIIPGSDYYFSFWVNNLLNHNNPIYNNKTLPRLYVKFNWVDYIFHFEVGGIPTNDNVVVIPRLPNQWVQICGIWHADPGVTDVTFDIFGVENNFTIGNDIGIDNIEFRLIDLPLIADAGPDPPICNGGTGCVNIGGSPSASGGTAPYTYSWTSNPSGFTSISSNPSVCPTVTTTYTLTVTDANGCSATDDVTVTVNPTANAGTDQTIFCNGNCVTIGGIVPPTGSGGTSPYSYQWSSVPASVILPVANPNVCPTVTTTYTVTVTDANGCTAMDDVTVTVPSLVSAWPYHPTGSGGTDFEEGMSVATDAAGNVYAVGNFTSDNMSLAGNNFDPGTSDIYLAKFAPDASLIWANHIGGTGDDHVKKVIVDGNGDIIITGSHSDLCDFGNGYWGLVGAGTSAYVAKYNANGNCIGLYTNTSLMPYIYNIGSDIAVDGSNIYVVGTTYDNSSNLWDIFLFGLNSPGLTLSMGPVFEGSTNGLGNGIAYYAGKIIITGKKGLVDFYRVLSIGSGSGGGNDAKSAVGFTYNGIAYAFVAGTNGHIFYYWVDLATGYPYNPTTIPGTGGPDYATRVDIDQNGDIFMTGQFKSPTVTFPKYGGGTIVLTNTGTWNNFVAKYDKTYNDFYWAINAGYSTLQETMDISVNNMNGSTGNCYGYITGVFSGDILFNQLLTASGEDAYIARIHDYYPTNYIAYEKIANPDSLQTHFSENNINVYPNPANDKLFFDISFDGEIRVKISICNLLGDAIKLVDEGVYSKKQIVTNISDLSSGVYLIRVEIPDKTIIKKQIIIK